MGVSVTTIAPTRRLTRKEHVKRELTSIPSTDDALLDALIDQESAAIVRYCHRPFARESVVEACPGFGDLHLQVSRTPIVSVSSVLFDSDVITDYSIDDRDEGTLYRRDGWWWTRQVNAGLTGRQRWPGFGQPVPNSEEPRFTVAMVGGYILPSQNLEAVNTIAAANSDNSFNDSGNGFPSLLGPGDVIVASGFTNAVNNGRFKVVTATISKIVVASTVALALEGAGAARTITFEPPADCLPFDDVEKAAVEAVKAAYLDREKAPHTRRERVGDLDIDYTDPAGIRTGLPVTCVGYLQPYVREA